MPTIHCKKCTPEKPCGGYHLYVLEFNKDVEEAFIAKSKMGYLYVGSTSKSVEDRFLDNFMKKDGEWKYKSRYARRIRDHFKTFRPDLFYFEMNPIPKPKKKIKETMEIEEGKLADKLRKAGYRVGGPSWEKMKKKLSNV